MGELELSPLDRLAYLVYRDLYDDHTPIQELAYSIVSASVWTALDVFLTHPLDLAAAQLPHPSDPSHTVQRTSIAKMVADAFARPDVIGNFRRACEQADRSMSFAITSWIVACFQESYGSFGTHSREAEFMRLADYALRFAMILVRDHRQTAVIVEHLRSEQE